MWIVRLALRRPYTFVVVSLLMLLFGIGTCIEAPKDIYPYINIPVVTIVWSYNGLPPQEIESRIVTIRERALTTTVNDIEHTELESYQGVSVIRVFFQPSVKVELAMSQITAVVQTILRVLPPGTFPLNILKYDASSVPILPAGVARIGDREFVVKLNSSPPLVSALNDLPIRAANGAVVLVKDVAQVRLGYAHRSISFGKMGSGRRC
jgi:multidrug efflux pump subunit AcrB